MYKKSCVLISFFVVMVLFAGCGTFGINLDSPEKKYLAARSELNLLLEQYIQIQNQISDADHEIAKTAFYSADKALDTWELMIGNPNYDMTTDIKTWLEAKHVIMEILRKVVN